MNIDAMKALSNEVASVMPWIHGIADHQQYEELIALMDKLVEDYEANETLIDMLFPVLHQYEEEAEHFRAFNERVDGIEPSVSMLRLIIDQHGLKLDELPEVGSKSLVSLILKGKRSLTIPAIRRLSRRFGVPTHMFI